MLWNKLMHTNGRLVHKEEVNICTKILQGGQALI